MAVEAIDPAQEYEAKLIALMKPVNELTARGTSAVQQFYSGATVFLTGGSGFLGKQLIEKLFRATKVSKIFLLLRSKKGKSVEQRLIEMLQDPVYDLLREQEPDFAKKLVPVSGDVAELKLGLSEEDWKAITEQVDIVFHLAATTRFDEPLRVATLINVRGTRETLILGKACKNLRSFVYVSTAYSHACTDRVNTAVCEKFYKSPISPNAMIEIAETVDEGRINDITPSLIKNWPNTYTFAKSIAEHLVTTLGNDLPICVVRPAIVACSKLEPTPGWVDMSCIYGASGLFTALGVGAMHTVKAENSCAIAVIPVDHVNNVVIAAGYETAKKRVTGENETKIYVVCSSLRNRLTWVACSKLEPTPGWVDMSCIYGASGLFTALGVGAMHTVKAENSCAIAVIPVDHVNNVVIAAGYETAKKRVTGENETKIYVVCSSLRNRLTWGDGHKLMANDVKNYASPIMVGYPFAWCSKNPILFWIYSWLLHLIPAYIIDGISAMLGNKRRFVKLASKMYNMSTALSYFVCNEWQFDDQNTEALFNSLSKNDRDIFNFDIEAIDWTEYLTTWAIGLRKYILKDGLTGTVFARRKRIVLGVLTFILLPLYFYCLFRILCLPLSVFTLLS